MRKHGYLACIADDTGRYVGKCCCGHRTRPAVKKLTAQRNLVAHIHTARTRRRRKTRRTS